MVGSGCLPSAKGFHPVVGGTGSLLSATYTPPPDGSSILHGMIRSHSANKSMGENSWMSRSVKGAPPLAVHHVAIHIAAILMFKPRQLMIAKLPPRRLHWPTHILANLTEARRYLRSRRALGIRTDDACNACGNHAHRRGHGMCSGKDEPESKCGKCDELSSRFPKFAS